MKYIPLNVKTNYELLSSIIKIDDLIYFALDNNISTIGVTDSNMFSCIELYNKCKKNSIKFIIGVEIEILNIIIYAKNYKGYVALCNIVSKKNLDIIDIDYIKRYSYDIIVCTSYKNYNNIKDLFDIVYIYYDNESDKDNALILSDNVIYLPKILCLEKSDNEYLLYLEHIKQKNTINDSIDLYNNHYIINNNEFDINTTIKLRQKYTGINPNNIINVIKRKFKTIFL